MSKYPWMEWNSTGRVSTDQFPLPKGLENISNERVKSTENDNIFICSCGKVISRKKAKCCTLKKKKNKLAFLSSSCFQFYIDVYVRVWFLFSEWKILQLLSTLHYRSVQFFVLNIVENRCSSISISISNISQSSQVKVQKACKQKELSSTGYCSSIYGYTIYNRIHRLGNFPFMG